MAKDDANPEEEKFFAGPFKPSNMVLAAGLAWFAFMAFYPLKYSNSVFAYFVILTGGIVAYLLTLSTSKNQIIAIPAALAFSAMMPFVNDALFPSNADHPCQVIGKYYWVSPNKKQGKTSLRLTYQLKCSDGIKEVGGAFFPERTHGIGEAVTLQKGFFNFQFIQEED